MKSNYYPCTRYECIYTRDTRFLREINCNVDDILQKNAFCVDSEMETISSSKSGIDLRVYKKVITKERKRMDHRDLVVILRAILDGFEIDATPRGVRSFLTMDHDVTEDAFQANC